ncbi:MAG: hypothetical protein GY847_34375 [Proteobacteria bacterium]|nr:hypothetical protein [Pseudomonadota bacterium]
MAESRAIWLSMMCTLLFAACGAPELPSSHPGMPGPSVTVVESAQNPEPWLIEWDGDARMTISNQLAKGIALVRYVDGALALMPECSVSGGYEGGGASGRPSQEKSITSESDVEAVLGIKLVAAKGKFAKGERWSLKYTVADVLEAEMQSVPRAELPAGCEGATHFISRAYLGAYVLDTGAKRRLEGKIGLVKIPVLKAGVGGGMGGETTLVVSDGDYEVCNNPSTPKSDATCAGLLKIGLMKVGE